MVTGAAGQDGTILATRLAQQGAHITGLVKPGTAFDRLRRYVPSIDIAGVDLADSDEMRSVLHDAQPHQIFNLGGFTAPAESWDRPDEVQAINVDSVAVILEYAKTHHETTRVFQASSSHIFEGTDRSPQNEDFELSPASPYAKSKADALGMIRAARAKDGVFAVSGILYNHESPLRSDNFVTRKVTKSVAHIAAGLQSELHLGDIEVARDWGWAPDYVNAMQLMMNADAPRDYVLATGISHRLSFFVQRAFRAAGIENWHDYVRTEGTSDRPVDTNKMVGDSRAAYLQLGWRHTVDFERMARAMVEYDIAVLNDPELLWTDFAAAGVP